MVDIQISEVWEPQSGNYIIKYMKKFKSYSTDENEIKIQDFRELNFNALEISNIKAFNWKYKILKGDILPL